MRHFNFLSKLISFEPTGLPFISVYLNTEPNETGKKVFGAFLKKQLSDAMFRPRSAEEASFERDIERIMEFAENMDPATRGAAVFASFGSGEFFETFEFRMPFEQSLFFNFDRAHIYPLVRLISRHPTYALVQADTNAARIYVLRRGETLDKEEFQNVKTSRSEVGGWSQMRYQRHLENFHQQHAKEVVAELEKIVREERIERIVFAGDQAVIIPLLRKEMSAEALGKVAASLALGIRTPESELLESAELAIIQDENLTDKEKISRLHEEAYNGGIGVAGVERTLAALLEGRVQELYISSDLKKITFSSTEVEMVLRDYEPGEERDLPNSKEKRFVIDEIIKLAAGSVDEIRFIGDPHLLATDGGVGAILRYKAQSVTNR